MYFRVRASLTERPGALAALATRCGEADLNILGLQIFPDLGRVTDELVISASEPWTAEAVADLVGGAGGDEVSVEPCTTHDLLDQPTRWLAAAADVIADPALLGPVLEALLGDRSTWTATEHARAAALGALVTERDEPEAAGSVGYEVTGSGVLARLGGHVVGAAALAGDGPVAELTVQVAPAWRRLGIGTALLTRAASMAAGRGLTEVVLVAPAHDEGLVPMVCRAGFRARVRVTGEELQARLMLTRTADPAAVRR